MSRAWFTTPEGCRLVYDIDGNGPVVLWQHGLGATFEQPKTVFPKVPVTRITLACRGHEESDLGPLEDLSIATFARDALALLDHLGVQKVAVAGGISIGAAVALRIAAYHPARVSKLVLARPAYVDRPSLHSQTGYVAAGQHIENFGLKDGKQKFQDSEVFRNLLATSADNANSLLGCFDRPRPDTTTALLARLPMDWPGVPMSMLVALQQDSLVIGNGEDVAHPLSHAQTLAELIPRATLAVIPSKTVDATAYGARFRSEMKQFLVEGAK